MRTCSLLFALLFYVNILTGLKLANIFCIITVVMTKNLLIVRQSYEIGTNIFFIPCEQLRTITVRIDIST